MFNFHDRGGRFRLFVLGEYIEKAKRAPQGQLGLFEWQAKPAKAPAKTPPKARRPGKGRGFAVGTVRIWKDGKKYRKTAPGQWEPVEAPKAPEKEAPKLPAKPEPKEDMESLQAQFRDAMSTFHTSRDAKERVAAKKLMEELRGKVKAAKEGKAPAKPEPEPPKAEAPKPKPEPPAKPETKGEPKQVAFPGTGKEPGGIEQVGDHIWGSRKDLAGVKVTESSQLDGMSFSDAAHIVSKARVVEVPDVETLKGYGQTPGAAHMTLALITAIKAKPADTDAARRQYVDGVRELMGGIQRCKTMADLKGLTREMQSRRRRTEKWASTGHYPDGDPNNTDKKAWFRLADRLSKETGESHRVFYSQRDYRFQINKEQSQPYDSLGKKFVMFLERRGKVFNDAWREANRADDMEAATPNAGWTYLEVRDQTTKAKREGPTGRKRTWSGRQVVSEAVERSGGKTVQTASAKRTKDTFNLREVDYGQRGYMSAADREYHTARLEEAMSDFADVLGMDPKLLSFNGRLGVALGARGRGRAAAHYEAGRYVINITKFRGGGTLAHEWGHALDNILAEHYIEHTRGTGYFMSEVPDHSKLPPEVWKALTAVDEAINTPVDDMEAKQAREKALAAAVGARDEYLAKNNTLVRELNALQPKIVRVTATEEEKARYNAVNKEYKANRAEYNRANKGVRDMRKSRKLSNYAADANMLGKKYWGNPQEKFARAFEAYLEDKLHAAGRSSTYLVAGTRPVYATGKAGAHESGAQPYPQGKERERINAALDAFMGVIHEQGHLAKAIEALRLRRLVNLAKDRVRGAA